MKAFVIGHREETAHTRASANLHSGIDAQGWTPAGVEFAMAELEYLGLKWTWPLTGSATIDGLTCHAYKTRDHRARVSCFLAHYGLWNFCVRSGTTLLILESDAQFTRFFDPAELDAYEEYGMISLNDPRGATRKAHVYHSSMLQASTRLITKLPDGEVRFRHSMIVEAPWVDDDRTIPQGLPGHSAYVIQPWFAHKLCTIARINGAMPNDALANKQWFPGKLGCLTNYATRVNGRPSTLA